MKKLFLILSILNFFDGVISYYGYISGHMAEMNPLMDALLLTSPISFLFLKIWISAILFGVGMFSFKFNQSKVIKPTLIWVSRIMNVVYAIIMLLHLKWITEVFIL